MEKQIRILIVDDHAVFRDGLRTLLINTPDTLPVGEAANGREAVERAAELKPDVIIMDLQMPVMDGVEATRQIVEAQPEVNVLICTMFQDDASVFAAMRAGARGYVLKEATHRDLLLAVRAVYVGDAIFSASVARRMVEYFHTAIPRSQAPMPPFPELSDREREVLVLMAHGLDNGAIAGRLTVSLKTVRNHVSNILAKLQVAGRVEAVMRARDAGLA